METARSLRYVITRTVAVRTQATRGILVSSLALAALGTVAAASPGHVSAGHVHPSIILTSCKAGSKPRTLTTPAIRNGPWLFSPAAIRSGPWLFWALFDRSLTYHAAPHSVRAKAACKVVRAPALRA